MFRSNFRLAKWLPICAALSIFSASASPSAEVSAPKEFIGSAITMITYLSTSVGYEKVSQPEGLGMVCITIGSARASAESAAFLLQHGSSPIRLVHLDEALKLLVNYSGLCYSGMTSPTPQVPALRSPSLVLEHLSEVLDLLNQANSEIR